MARKSEFTADNIAGNGNGFNVLNGSTKTNVISQAGKVQNSALKFKTIQQTVAFGDFTDGGAAVGTLDLTNTLPIGAVVLQTLIDDVTGFTGDTSAVITVGDGTDVDRYNTGTPNIFVTATAISAGAVSGTAFGSIVDTVKLTVTSAADFTAVTAGALTITIHYLTD